MRSRVVIALALAAAAAAAGPGAAPAAAQVWGPDGEGARRQTTMPLRIDGVLTIGFRGHGPTCDATGMCGVSGTISIVPGGSRRLTLLEFEGGRRPQATVESEGRDAGRTRVTRAGADGTAHTCSDAWNVYLPLVGRFGGDGYAPFGLRALEGDSGGLIAGRCTAALGRDVVAALPSAVLHVRAVRQGSAELDLSGERVFTAGGLTGTVRSTMRIELGTATTRRVRRERQPEVPARRRLRVLVQQWAVERLDGSAQLAAQAAGDPFPCAVVDACGLAAAVRAAPALREGAVWLTGVAPARRSTRRQLEAALGLRRGRVPRRVHRGGYGAWSGRGTVSASATYADGTVCRSESPLVGGDVRIGVSGGRLRATWVAAPGALRSRCPGPAGTQESGHVLLRGSLPLAALRDPRPTLRLARGGTFRSPGFAGTTTGSLALQLRRVSLRHLIVRE